MNMDKLKVGSKIKVVAPDRVHSQIGTGIGHVIEIEPSGIWVRLIGSDKKYFEGFGTFFTVCCNNYTFKALKY